MSTSKEEIAQVRIRMEKAVDDLKKELATIRTGRASISILDSILVDYYGVPTPINQVAQMGTPDATLITVQPYDVSLVGPIEKAIRASDLGLNPVNDGKVIRIGTMGWIGDGDILTDLHHLEDVLGENI